MSRRVDLDRAAVLTNVLSNVLLLVTAGLSLLIAVGAVLRAGCRRPPAVAACDWLIVPGHALEAGEPSRDFRARLDRVLALAGVLPDARILVLGGVVTGQVKSEAQAGADYLAARGVAPARITGEALSRHTLENFQQALPLLTPQGRQTLVLVTNRYHLARAVTMARNLGLRVQPCPAEARVRAGLLRPWLVLWEAYLLHWYHTGRLYAQLMGNHGMLFRVSRRPGRD